MRITFHFTASESWISRLIRWATDQTVSHTAIEIEWGELGGRVVLESTWPNVRPIDAITWHRQNNVVRSITPDWDFAPARDEIRRHLAAFYDFSGLVGDAWVFLLRKLGRGWVADPLDDPEKDTCSEFATVALKAAKFPGAEKIPALSASPGDVLAILEAHRT